MARQDGARATGKQVKTIIQARGDLFGTQSFYPRGGQFDRQRDAVEAVANLGDNRRVVFRHAEMGIYQ
jgi:hypothetical protein